MKLRLAINVWSVSINGSNGGRRLSPSKCCGSWQEIVSWPIDPDVLLEDIKHEIRAEGGGSEEG